MFKNKRITKALSAILALILIMSFFQMTSFAETTPTYSLGCLEESIDPAKILPPLDQSQLAGLPSSVDLSLNNCPTVGDQGNQGSCVGWAVGYAYKTYQEKMERNWSVNTTDHQFSPSYIYNQICIGNDGGAYTSDAFDLLVNQGCAALADMPYNQYDYKTKPTSTQKTAASKYKALSWNYLQTGSISDIKARLASGDAVVASIKVYTSFDKLTPINPIQTTVSGVYRGNHAICVVGYNDANSTLKILNSWGTVWGASGYGYIQYDVFQKINNALYVMTDIIDVAGVKLNKSSSSLKIGESEKLTATVTPSNATYKTVAWSSSNTAVATVDSTGKVTGKATGTVTITAKTSDAAGTNTATCVYTISNYLSLSVANKTMKINEGYFLLAMINGEYAAPGTKVSWSSNNKSVATITSYGRIFAEDKGTAVITATTNDGLQQASCTITVTGEIGSRITGNDTGGNVYIGTPYKINPVQYGYKTDVVWLSSDKNTATVDNTGTITGVSEGKVDIWGLFNDLSDYMCYHTTVISKNPHTVTYNYSYNGGNSSTKIGDTVNGGDSIDLTPVANKSDNWSFVGWNTNKNATTKLTSLTMGASDITLYAIYKKTLTARFLNYNGYSPDSSVTIYNNADSGVIAVSAPWEFTNWEVRGWGRETLASGPVLITPEMKTYTISQSETFYAFYKRLFTLSYNANGGTSTPKDQTAMTYAKSSGGYSSTFQLAAPIDRKDYIFVGWAKSPTGKTYAAGSDIAINEDTTMFAVWEIDNTKFANAISISLNTTVSVNVTAANQKRYYVFTAPTTGPYTFMSSDCSGDPYGWLYNSAQTQIAYNDDSNGTNFSITYNLTAGQKYYIAGGCYSTGTGSYKLKVIDNTTFDGAASISLNTSVSVNVTAANQKRYYVFTAPTTGPYTFMSSDCSGDPYGWLYNSAQTQIAYNDDSNGTNFSITYNLTAGQKYYIAGGCCNTGTGSYKLKVIDNTTFDGAASISLNTSVSVNVTAANQKRYYVFTAPTTGPYTFMSSDCSGDPYGWLYNSAQTQIALNDDSNGTNFSITYNLTAGQKYYIAGGCYGTGTGSYKLKVIDNTTFDGAASISLNTPVSVNVTAANQKRYYVFTAPTTGPYTFVSSDCNGDPYGWLYNSTQSQLSYNDDSRGTRNFAITYNLTAGQKYYIAGGCYSTGTGSYKLWAVMAGDANDDRCIDLSDVLLVQKYVANIVTFSERQLMAADVNRDGVVDGKDVTLIQQYVAKLIIGF